MVFESVVTDVLNKVLGDYVENLDRTQLKIGIWGGDVVLNNLKLRENALDDLDLPVQLVSGFLGKLVLKIPWKNLYGQPVVAQVEDFYILISPKQSIEYNAEKEAKYDLQAKQAALQKIEEAKRLELEKDKPKPDQSFTEKLTAQIVNNLQMKIANVHIRYEDTTTTGKPFAFGITLSELELYTTDVNWLKCYMTEQASRVYKIANLDSLSVYMNCDADLFTHKRDNIDEISSLFRNNIARKDVLPSRYNYIIGPISSMAKLQLNMNPEYDDPPFVIPKIDLSLEMEKLHIGITSTQFQDILKLGDSMNRMQLGQPYRKYRPFNKPYKGHYKEWWKFAITSVLEEDIRRKTRHWCWDHIKEHRELCNTYATSLKEKQLCKKPTAALIETCNLCEQKLDLFNLILIHNRVQLEVDKVKEAEQKKASEKKGWFSGWWGGSQANEEDTSNNIVKKFEAAMTDAEKEKLYKAIGYQQDAVQLAIPEHYEAIKMNFKLEALEIGVYDDFVPANAISPGSTVGTSTRTAVMLMNFTLATCNVVQRPSANAISVTARVKEMELTGLRKGDYVPTLIESLVTDELSLLDVLFETNPLDKKCDQRIKVYSRPLQIIYDSDTILQLAKAFTPPKSVNLSEIEGAASERMSHFKERSATGMQYIVDQHQILEVDIKFMPNIVILPAKGKYIPGDSSLIVLSLGEFRITSAPRSGDTKNVANMHGAGHDSDAILRSMMAKSYDKFKVELEDIQVLVVKPKENWQNVLKQGQLCEMHVLQHTSLIVTAEVCVITDDPRLPKTKVGILIPSVMFNITEDRIFEALNIVTGIPLPESNEPEPSLKKSASLVATSRASVSRLIDQEILKVKTKKPSQEELSTEIIQYTNLELNFALKEFGVTLYKCKNVEQQRSFDETPSDKFRTPVEEMAPNGFEDCSNQFEGVPNSNDKILSFQVLQLEGFMAQRTYELVATVKLGAINLSQYDNFEDQMNVLSIIDTPRTNVESEYLLTVGYTMVNKTTPEFSTKYNSTEQLIVVNFAKLALTLHQECLLKLMEIGCNLQQKLDVFNKTLEPKDRVATTDTESILTKLTTIVEEVELDDGVKIKRERTRSKRKVVDSIKVKVVANLEQVSVCLTCRKRDLVLLKVQNFFAGVVMKSSYTELTLLLKNIIVWDLNPVTKHPTILSIVGDNALKCQVVMFNLEETANYNSDDLKVDVNIGCVRIVFLNWFVTSALCFFNNFQAAQAALASASAAAADAARQNAIDAYQKATRMKLNIKIKAPIIVVPVNSLSLDGVSLDLGMLSLSNVTSEISVPENEHSPAILDEIRLELKDMKLSKVQITQAECPPEKSVEQQLKDGASYAALSLDDSTMYGLKGHVNMLDPISFNLAVKRNLSSSWYKDLPEVDVSGHLKSIELNLYADDYALLMSILNNNLSEGQNEFETVAAKVSKPDEVVVEIHQKADVRQSTDGKSPRHKPSSAKSLQPTSDKQKIYEQFRFSFQFDGVIVNLFQANQEGLARFGIHFLSVKGKILIDGTLSTSVVLCDIQIDDIRPNLNSKITKYLCRKEWKREHETSLSRGSDFSDSLRAEKNYMLDLTAIVKENDTFAEIRVCGFDLIITIDFLVKLAEFFTLPETETPEEVEEKAIALKAGETKSTPKTPKKTVATQENAPEKKLNLLLYIEEPDIILIESLEDVNTNAIVFNSQVRLNYRAIGPKEIISGQIDALKMYMCSFSPEKREATKHFILHPCVISLHGSTPDQEGLHISLKMTDIILNISPATIELINKAMVTLSSRTEKVAALAKEFDHTGVWVVEKFSEKDYWFLVDQALDVLEIPDIPEPTTITKTEKCIVEVPSITLVVETGVGYYTTPMLCIETKLNATVANWSQNMKIEGALNLHMNYFNQALAMWEPLIEQVEKPDKSGIIEYVPWELNFGLEIQPNKSEIEDEIEEPTTKIKIESEEMLEITMSKTCLDTLQVLGEAFSNAIDAKGLNKPEVIAPYVVENDTGFDLSLNLTRGIFTLHECHMPNTNSRNEALNSSLVFKCDVPDSDLSPDQVKDCTISPGGRAYLQTKDLSKITSAEDEAYNIYCMVVGINKEVLLPVSKSDQRYFPLYRGANQDPWGIISQVISEYGTTRINIHGVVNVKNHFTTTISVYRNKHGTTEKVLVGDIGPGEVFHVPLHAIYAESKDLFFALPGYKVSVQGIRWNDCPTDFNYQRQIQCDPVDTFEPLYINAVRQKIEVFHENTMKFMLMSAFYTIHLRPPLYMRNALPIDIKVSVTGCTVRDTNKATELDESDDIDKVKSIIKEDMLDYGEKDVKPGDVLHLPTVKLTGRRNKAKSYVVVRLIQYLEKDWSCTTEISEDHEEYATWTFTSYDSAAKMDMDLGVRFQDRYGSLMLTIYSPFWMINKTGLMLSYKTNTESVNVLYHPPEYNGPILFSFREKFFFDKKRASIRVDNGEWSEKIPLDVAGSTGEVTCNANDQLYHIGVHNHLTQNSLTKQITFIPFYIATNKCDVLIELQEHSRPGDPWIKIEPNACIPFWPKSEIKKVILKVAGQTTVPFDYSEVQCILLKLEHNKYGGINVDVQVTEGGAFITFTQYNAGDAPGLLINHTNESITFQEKGNVNKKILGPSEKVLFTWAEPAGSRLLLLGKDNVENDLRRDGVGSITMDGGLNAFWVSFLDGLQRVILFTDMSSIAEKVVGSSDMQKVNQEIEIRIHGIGLSVLNNITGVDILYLGIKSSGIIWEAKKEGKKRFKQLNITDSHHIEEQYQTYLAAKHVNEERKFYLDQKHELDFDRMILHKSTDRVIKRTFYPGFWLDLKTSPFQTQLHAKINKIQIDNQLSDCIFPVVLAPIPPPKSIAANSALKPFIECSIVERVVPNSTVNQFKYCTMLIQEFHFKVDILFLSAIAEMFTSDLSDEQAAKLFNEDVNAIEKPLSALVEIHSAQEHKNFYDNLHLGPLKIHVSFSMAGSDTTALPGLLSTIVQGVGVTLTDVNDVVFKLAFFEREYGFFTQRQLISEITAHYTGQALKQLYVLVLGLDVIGNPYGLVVGLKTGVQDLFYEPFQGAIQGPGEFAEGLVLGVKSLFGHTVGGAAGAVSKITGAMGKGLAALTFDEDYQKKRRQALNKKPANFQEGIARSGKGLVMGFADGVSGVFTKPISGAKEEGVEGFFKGLGKGAIGLVARPTAGVVDFASGSFEAVKRATESSEDTNRLRPPRFMHPDGVLRPYSLSEANGNKLLKEIEKGKYASTDAFAHCEEVIAKQEVLLVSNHRVIYATKNDLFGTWTIHWTYLWNEISSIVSSDRGVEIILRKENKKVLGFFSSSEVQRKVVNIPQRARRDNLASLMESLRTGT